MLKAIIIIIIIIINSQIIFTLSVSEHNVNLVSKTTIEPIKPGVVLCFYNETNV